MHFCSTTALLSQVTFGEQLQPCSDTPLPASCTLPAAPATPLEFGLCRQQGIKLQELFGQGSQGGRVQRIKEKK